MDTPVHSHTRSSSAGHAKQDDAEAGPCRDPVPADPARLFVIPASHGRQLYCRATSVTPLSALS